MEEAPQCPNWQVGISDEGSHGIVLLIHDGMIGRQHPSYIGLQFSLISPDAALVSVSQQ